MTKEMPHTVQDHPHVYIFKIENEGVTNAFIKLKLQAGGIAQR